MSQRGSAPRPASRRSPKTSPEAAFSSPRSSQPSPQAGIRRRDDTQAPTLDPGGASNVVTDDGGRPESSGARTSDVHGILNASESRQYPESTASFAGQPTEEESSGANMGGPRPQGQGGPPFHPYVFQGQQPPPTTTQSAYQPIAPSSVPGLPQPAGGERGSPTLGPPLPPLGVPRRMLTPRSPRVASLSRAARRGEELQNPLPPRQPSLSGSASAQDLSPRSGLSALGGPSLRALPQAQSLGPGAALLPPTIPPVGVRSLSQPIVGHALPPAVPPEYLHSSSRPPLPGPGQPSYASQPPTGGPGGETRWSTGGYGSLAGLPWGRGLGENQHLLTITPQYGEEIVVPVDTHQGSKTQDQKRQKNAIASARFRTRKKEREHQLEVDNHELGIRVRELEVERDFYRNERNRLRDIVSRTPSISEWANGPPSPVSSRAHGSFAGEGGGSGPMGGGGTSHGQGGPDQQQPLMTGSPARRRRGGPQTRSPPRVGGSYGAESGSMAGAPRPQGHAYQQHQQQHPTPYSYGPPHPPPPPPEPPMGEPPARRRRIEHEPPQFTTPSYGPLPPTTLPPPPSALAPASYGLNPPRHHPPPPASPGVPRLPPLRGIEQPSPTTEHPPPLPQQAQHQQQQQQQQQQSPYPPPPPAYNRPSYEPGWPPAPQGPQEGGQR